MEETKYRLSDIADVQTGPFGSQLHNEDYVSSGTPIVTVEHLGSRKFTTQNLPRVSDADKMRLSKYSLKTGDIVFSRVGSVDRCSYVSDEENGWLFSGRCLRVRCSDKVMPLYLYYFFCLPSVKRYIRNIAVGATMPSINTSLLSEIQLELPDMSIQRTVAGILSSIDDKIELNRRINDNLEQQTQAAFDYLLDQYADTEKILLGQIADINPSRKLSKGTVARCVEMTNMPTIGSFPTAWIEKEYTGGMKFQNGDTLMARITPCLENGKTAYVNFLAPEEVAFGSTEYIVISAKAGIEASVFYFLARNKEFVDYAVKNMNGSSGRQRVSGDTIGAYQLPTIPDAELNKFGAMAKASLDVIRENCLQNMELASIRDAILPKLMSGALKIKDLIW